MNQVNYHGDMLLMLSLTVAAFLLAALIILVTAQMMLYTTPDLHSSYDRDL